MPKLEARRRLTKTIVEAVPLGDMAWDSEVPGFAARRLAGGVSYVLKYRIHSRQRWHTIGRHGAPWTVDLARTEARRLLGLVAAGEDPGEKRAAARADRTVAELCDDYLAAAPTLVLKRKGGTKSPTTLATDRGRIVRHIVPLLGHLRVEAVTSEDIEDFQRRVAAGETALDVRTRKQGRAIVTGGPGTAARTVGLLGGIFTFAGRKGDDNPVKGVARYADRKMERFLSEAEIARLGSVLAEAEAAGENRYAIAAIRLLALTGCRKSEILSLQWRHVDLEVGCLRLPTSKTGARVVMLGRAAIDLLAGLPRIAGVPWVLPGAVKSPSTEGAATPGKHIVGVPKIWERLRERAGLSDVRLHDLRHSFASISLAGGSSLEMIGALLGHADPKTTARYAHLAPGAKRSAAHRTDRRIGRALGGRGRES